MGQINGQFSSLLVERRKQVFQGICWTHLATCWESNANKPQVQRLRPLSSQKGKTMMLFFSIQFWCKTWSGFNRWFSNYLEKYQTWKMLKKSVDVVPKFPREHSEHLGRAFHNLLCLEPLDSVLGFQCGEMSPRECAGCGVGPKTHFSFQDRPTTGVDKRLSQAQFPSGFLLSFFLVFSPSLAFFLFFFSFFLAYFFNLIFILYWSIVDLQCFRCTAKWFSYTYTSIHSFSDSFLI